MNHLLVANANSVSLFKWSCNSVFRQQMVVLCRASGFNFKPYRHRLLFGVPLKMLLTKPSKTNTAKIVPLMYLKFFDFFWM